MKIKKDFDVVSTPAPSHDAGCLYHENPGIKPGGSAANGLTGTSNSTTEHQMSKAQPKLKRGSGY